MSVRLGYRYTRQHVIRRDTLNGTYEEVNSPAESSTERQVQLALLKKGNGKLTIRDKPLAAVYAGVALVLILAVVNANPV